MWDAEGRRLALPLDDILTDAEADVRVQLNERDAWSTVTPITFEVTHPVDPGTLDDAIAVWEFGTAPVPLDVVPELDDDGHTVRVPPPNDGWPRGATLLVVVRGGNQGIGTSVGPIGPDVAMGYLTSDRPLTEHPDAFPGSTRADRLAQAEALEAVRRDWRPYFAFVTAQGLDRDELGALWPFHVTGRGEVAMDAASEQVPLPSDLLLDPQTGLVELPADPDDDALRQDAKAVANTLDGFSLTGRLLFDVTADLDPRSVRPDTVQLWDLSTTPALVPTTAAAWREDGPCEDDTSGCRHVVVDPGPAPLRPGTSYALVVRSGLRTRNGGPLGPMPTALFLTTRFALTDVNGRSQIASLTDAEARRLEVSRARLAPLVAQIGRNDIVSAWSITTLDRTAALRATVDLPASLGLDPTPTVTTRRPAYDLLGDDALTDLFPGPVNPAIPLYVPRTDGIAEVVEGTLLTADHLDPVTRRWRDTWVPRAVDFVATLPEDASANEPVPVVIFAHAVTTDRRFALTIGGPLARRGFATLSIDLPFHGERTVCVARNLVAVPNPLPESVRGLVGLEDDLVQWPPCASGGQATCAPTGACLDADGQPEPFSALPVVDLRPASGAAFLDAEDLPHIPDHFRQALVDVAALRRSLQTADWETALGQRIDTQRFRYLGQSLGGILGVVYVSLDPTIERAVFNVAGGGLVDVFEQSTFFGPQLDAYLDRIDVVPGTWEHEELIHVAHWLIDTVDPLMVAPYYRDRPDLGLIQIDRIDDSIGDFVVPNATSEVLAEASGLPLVAYPSVLHGDLAIPVVGDAMLDDAADFLAGP